MKIKKINLTFLYLCFFIMSCYAETSGQSFLLAHNGDFSLSSIMVQASSIFIKVDVKNFENSSSAIPGSVGFGQSYFQSTNGHKLGQYFFFNGSNTMKFGPAKTSTNDTDVFGLNFLLDESYEGTATLNPQVKTCEFSLHSFVNLGVIIPRLWCAVDIPLVYTHWNPNLTSTTETQNGAAFADHAFINGANSASPYNSIQEAWKGDQVPATGYYNKKWSYGIIDGAHSQTAIGNAKVVLGYNLLERSHGYFDIGIVGLLNGSPKSKAYYLFEPTIGTAGRHGAGFCINGNMTFYEKDSGILNCYVRADLLHIFGATMRRSYDYAANGKGSRYLLVRRHTAYNGLDTDDGVLNSINITSLRAKIGIDALLDMQVLFRWSFKKWDIDLGCAVYGHTKEKHEKWIDTIAPGTFTFYAAGNANAEGVGGSTGAVKLYPTITIDGAQGAAGDNMADASDLALAGITENNLNKASGLQPAVLSYCLYAGITHCWSNEIMQPFISLGAGYEISTSNTALHQWNVSLTGGLAF